MNCLLMVEAGVISRQPRLCFQRQLLIDLQISQLCPKVHRSGVSSAHVQLQPERQQI